MAKVGLDGLVRELDALLDPTGMDDYGPNGLQVEGRAEIRRIATAVTASRNVIDRAIADDADALLVHHGLFWKTPEPPRLTGWLGQRVRRLMAHDISLIAYHLPLDVHPELGNNARLMQLMGAYVEGRFGAGDIGFLGTLERPTAASEVVAHLGRVLGQPPVHLHTAGAQDALVHKVGVVSGAGDRYFDDAVAAGCDLFVTGEASERVTHVARETGVHYVWGGHHATERFGVQALGDHLRRTHDVLVEFVDEENPV